MGNTPSSRPTRKTAGNSRPLAVCSVMSDTLLIPGVELVAVGHQGHRLQEFVEAVVLAASGELGDVRAGRGPRGCPPPPARRGTRCARPPSPPRHRGSRRLRPCGAAAPGARAAQRYPAAPCRSPPPLRHARGRRRRNGRWRAAEAARRSTEASPTPRRGTFTTRRADTSSEGFPSRRT